MGVGVGVGVGAGVGVGVAVGVGVGVAAGVGVGVGVGAAAVTTSCGGFAASRLWKIAPSFVASCTRKPYRPFPGTADAGSVACFQPVDFTAIEARVAPLAAGALFHVSVDSVHVDEVAAIDTVFELWFVTYRRRTTDVTGVVSPLTSNCRYDRQLALLWLARSVVADP